MTTEEKDIYAMRFFAKQPNEFGTLMSRRMRQMLDVDLSGNSYQVIIDDIDGRTLSNFKNSFNNCRN